MRVAYAVLLLAVLMAVTVPAAHAVEVIEYVLPAADEDLDPSTPNENCVVHPHYRFLWVSDRSGWGEVPPGFYEENFDDSSWLCAPAPFGDISWFEGACSNALSSAPDDLFVRKWFEIPASPKQVILYASTDDGAMCWINGTKVLDRIGDSHGPQYWNYTVDITPYVREGNNLLACWVANGGENRGSGPGYFDAAVLAVYETHLYEPLIVQAPAVAHPDSNIVVTIVPDYELTSEQLSNMEINVALIDMSNNVVAQTTAEYLGGSIFEAVLHLPSGAAQYIIVAESNVDTLLFYGASVIVASYESATYGLPITVHVDTMNAPLEDNGAVVNIELTVSNLSDRQVALDRDVITSAGGFFRLPIEFVGTSLTCDEATAFKVIFGDSVAYGVEDVLEPFQSKTYHIKVGSPYLPELESWCTETGDATICDYYEQAKTAATLGEQLAIYLTARSYMSTMVYGGGLSVLVVLPPVAEEGEDIVGIAYVLRGGEPTDPDSVSCEVYDQQGGTDTCTAIRINTGEYVISGLPSDAGSYVVKVTAVSGYAYAVGAGAYSVQEHAPQEAELIVMADAVPPGGQVLILYTLTSEVDPPPALTVFDRYANEVAAGAMEYNPTVGVYTYLLTTDANWADGDYIVRLTDQNTGAVEYAVLRVDSTLKDILNYVSDINTFLHTAIAPKLDALRSDVNNIYNYLNDNIYQKLADLESDVADLMQVISTMYADLNEHHEEELAYLAELNATAHQILQEVLYIKEKIDNVVIVKLNTLTDNQSRIMEDLNDIYALLTCEQSPTDSVCFMLQNMQIVLSDLNQTMSEINGDVDSLIGEISTVQSKLDTLMIYVQDVNALLNCSSAPPNSVCARLETLRARLEETYSAVVDTNTFLSHVYDYIRNDLMNAVLDVGVKVEDINSYLRGDIWNKLVDLENKLSATYSEVNSLIQLVGDHDSAVQAMLISMRAYLEDMNAQLSQKIEEIRTTLSTHFSIIEENISLLLQDTNALKEYFHCTQPNGVCAYLHNVESGVQEINAGVSDLSARISNLQNIVIAEFNDTKEKISTVESNIAELKSLMLCDTYPSTSVCARLDDMNARLAGIGGQLDEVYSYVVDIHSMVEDINEAVHEPSTWDMVFGSGGGGGGGAPMIHAIEVRYSRASDTVIVGLPEGIPDGTYRVFYQGDLFRYVETPPPKEEVNVTNGVLKLTVRPDVSGAVRGIVVLKKGAMTYKIRVTFIALDEPVYQMPSTDTRVVTVTVPEGGGYVEVLGEAAKCMDRTKFYFQEGGTYRIEIPCSAEGVVKVVGRLHEYSIQYSLESNVNPKQYDMFRTTILPIGLMLLALFILSLCLPK